jgi:hypothetical protein
MYQLNCPCCKYIAQTNKEGDEGVKTINQRFTNHLKVSVRCRNALSPTTEEIERLVLIQNTLHELLVLSKCDLNDEFTFKIINYRNLLEKEIDSILGFESYDEDENETSKSENEIIENDDSISEDNSSDTNQINADNEVTPNT